MTNREQKYNFFPARTILSIDHYFFDPNALEAATFPGAQSPWGNGGKKGGSNLAKQFASIDWKALQQAEPCINMIYQVEEAFAFWGTPEGDLVHPAECMQQLLEKVRRHRVNVCTFMVTTLVLEGWLRKLDPGYYLQHFIYFTKYGVRKQQCRRILACNLKVPEG
ncbi:uncharacterized protein Pyn_15001 [Prunus yedoensis var. nudiflora]|uniref:Uncharacterized protein n=1 Tax=Prunus yedoensis var. nudiflora TaxID=2094558 RepID=A0A314XJR4_PRUYE|nr:uncharacterized protein Pyn_15001 [Prunus yedoensis var. nudiflora]